MASVTEEQIAARRLLCKDTVLPSSAPSLKNVTKRLRRFAENLESEPAEAASAALAAFAKELDLYEFEMQRADMVGETCGYETAEYALAAAGSAAGSESLSAEIEELRAQLLTERATRKHREAYEALARKANALPPRAQTEAEIGAVRAALRGLEEQGVAADAQLQLRKRQVEQLLRTLADLTAALREEDEAAAAAAARGGKGGADGDEEMGEVGAGSDEEGRGRRTRTGDQEDEEALAASKAAKAAAAQAASAAAAMLGEEDDAENDDDDDDGGQMNDQ
jgi:hypothetical protein